VGAAKNGFGVVGVAPEASLVAVRIADDEVDTHETLCCLCSSRAEFHIEDHGADGCKFSCLLRFMWSCEQLERGLQWHLCIRAGVLLPRGDRLRLHARGCGGLGRDHELVRALPAPLSQHTCWHRAALMSTSTHAIVAPKPHCCRNKAVALKLPARMKGTTRTPTSTIASTTRSRMPSSWRRAAPSRTPSRRASWL